MFRAPEGLHERPAGAPSAPGVWARDLWRRFGRFVALAGIDLAVDAGTVAALLGPNAAGKTTLLRILATLDRADTGSASVGGYDVRAQAPAARRTVGLVAHQPLLYPDLTAEENLRFYAHLYGLPDDRDRPGRALDEMGLSAQRALPVRALSRGLTQRLAIARARLHDPRVLLLDEPHSGLDPGAADGLDEALRQLAGGGQTVLLATHDLKRAYELADQLIILAAGRVAWTAPRGAVDLAALRAAYRAATTATPPAGEGPGIGRHTAAHGWPVAVAPSSRPDPAAGRLPPPPADGGNVDVGTHADQPTFGRAIDAVVWKDLVGELRSRDVVPPVAVFALLVLVLFGLTLPPVAAVPPLVAPTVLWVALVFGSTLGLARTLGAEVDSGGMTGLLLSPADRGALFVAKWLGGLIFGGVVAAVLLPLVAAWLGLPARSLAALAGVLLLGLVGWVAAGTLLAAMAASTRTRELLLPVLLFPLVLPLLMPAVLASGQVIQGQPPAAWVQPLVLMAAYDVIFFVLGFLLFPVVVEGQG
jgi:heme exporter protein A